MKTDAEVTAYALRYLAEDCGDHRPQLAARLFRLAEQAEGTNPGPYASLGLFEALERADAALENALDFILTQAGPTEENTATFGWRKEAIITGTRRVLELIREAGRG